MIFSEWRKTTISNVATKVFSGGTPNTKIDEFWGGNIPWLSSGETRNRFIEKTENTITNTGINKSSTKLAKIGDTVIASAGQGFTRGQVSYCLIDTYINQSIIAIRPNIKIINSKFLFYNLSNRYQELRQISDANAIRGSLTTKLIGNLDIFLPSIHEQQKISEILSSIDEKIELNNKINKTLEVMAQAIFKSWFIDFEPFKDKEFIESEFGFIPKGWKVTNFSKYYDYVAGYSYSGDELVSSKTALLTIKNFDRNGGLRNDGFKEINPIKKVKEEKYAKLFDVVVACTDLTQKAEIIGNPLLVTSSAEYESMIFSMDLVKILPTTEMADSCFAYQILKDQRFKGFALKYVSGTTVLHLSKKAFNEYLLPLPYDFEIIQKYVEIVRPMFEKLVEIESENNRLIKVRDSLLPKLMSGEIRVPLEEVPNAEIC